MGSVGEGGQAHAYRVKDRRDGSTGWILKEIKNKDRLGRFEREIRALETIDSPHIPKTEDYSVSDPAYHVSKDLGVGLDKYVRSNPLTIDRALALFEQVVKAACDAHGTDTVVVHRDIKPNNVVVAPGGEKAYLIDFGLCQFSEDGEPVLLTRPDEPFGNPAFAAPECFLGREEEPGAPCDVYSLGKVLYWMVSRGSNINRENLSPAAIARIKTDNVLIRSYLVRLMRGVIVEDPAGRWTAPRLLERVRETRELVGKVQWHERRGETVLIDGFGVGEHFNESAFRSAMTKDPKYHPEVHMIRGGPPPDSLEVGSAFDVPAGRDVCLETITLALEYRAGEDELDVRVAPDADGEPDLDAVLESFRISGDRAIGPRVETVRSRRRPVLRRGQRYWVLLSAAALHSDIANYGAAFDLAPIPTLIGERLNGSRWEIRECEAHGPAYAVRVIGGHAAAR
jgi:hypothetical protein